jgi:hypothetical protein
MGHKYNFIGYTGDSVGTDKDPVEYKGFLVYERYLNEYGGIGGWIWAVVKDGKEISQLAGPNGAKRAIDKLIAPLTIN